MDQQPPEATSFLMSNNHHDEDHPLYDYVHWKSHLFSNHAYPEYSWLILQELVVPWWWRSTNGRCWYVSLLYRREELNWHRRRGTTPSLCSTIGDCMGYILGFPLRLLLAFSCLVVAPLLHPCYYLLERELMHAPQERQHLQKVSTEGVEVLGKIVQMERSKVLAIAFGLSKDNDDHDDHQTGIHHGFGDEQSRQLEYEYPFCNDHSEVNVLLGKGYDELFLGEEFPLIVLPYDKAVFREHVDYYEIWTLTLLEVRKQNNPPFSLQRFVKSILVAIISWNVTALVVLHIPCVLWLWSHAAVGDETSIVHFFWNYYQHVPSWMASVCVLFGLGSCCGFKPLSYWEYRFVPRRREIYDD